MRVELRPAGGRPLLVLAKDEEIVLAMSWSNLDSVLAGETIQISVKGAHCRMYRVDEKIEVVCAWRSAQHHGTSSVKSLEQFLRAEAHKRKGAAPSEAGAS
ncbi:MAG: hypothetical protein QOJ65_2086 [Fimbriimonadaceae bacterium]|nr:hypothetical protein [Fimbriimonadaceae bacterium]